MSYLLAALSDGQWVALATIIAAVFGASIPALYSARTARRKAVEILDGQGSIGDKVETAATTLASLAAVAAESALSTQSEVRALREANTVQHRTVESKLDRVVAHVADLRTQLDDHLASDAKSFAEITARLETLNLHAATEKEPRP